MTETRILPLLTWRRAAAESDLVSTRKLVALCLSLWMNERGASAFPGADTLAKDTSLSVRAVREHLAGLVEDGWLALVERGGMKGAKRHANVYAAVTPDPSLFSNGESSVTRAGGSPVTSTSPMGDPDDTDPCTSVTPSLQDLSKNSGKSHKRAVSPPKDYAPTPAQRQYATEQGLDLPGELERWLTDCDAKGRKYRNVTAGFSTWLHYAVDFGRGGKKPPMVFAPALGDNGERKVCHRCANTGNYFKGDEMVPCDHKVSA